VIDFATWSVRDARMYRDAYVASLPSRTQWLLPEITAYGADCNMLSSGGASGLGALWAWAADVIDTGPSTLELRTSQPAGDLQSGARPPWYDQYRQDPWLSDGALWLIELLGVHLANVIVRAKPGAHWAVYQASDEPDDNFLHRTMLFGANPRPVDPAGMIHISVIGHV
jgi:hypothetical protein